MTPQENGRKGGQAWSRQIEDARRARLARDLTEWFGFVDHRVVAFAVATDRIAYQRGYQAGYHAGRRAVRERRIA